MSAFFDDDEFKKGKVTGVGMDKQSRKYSSFKYLSIFTDWTFLETRFER